MSPVVPVPFLFRYSIPVRRIASLPKGGAVPDLPADFALPDFGELAGEPGFADVRMGWNVRGLGVSVRVPSKPGTWRVNTAQPEDSDGLQVWIDTRNTQSIHRASRFCHQFCILPTGGGARGEEPLAWQVPIPRAREEAPLADASLIRVELAVQRDAYSLAAWLPAEVLNGFDPEANPRLGFYYRFRAAGQGEQFLTVGHEFPYGYDPSVWSTLELVGDLPPSPSGRGPG